MAPFLFRLAYGNVILPIFVGIDFLPGKILPLSIQESTYEAGFPYKQCIPDR